MSKITKLLKDTRIIIYILFFVFMILAISPNPWAQGAAIRNVIPNSTAYNAGIASSMPSQAPMSREVIVSMNGQDIKSADDYYEFVSGLEANMSVSIQTYVKSNMFFGEKKSYFLETEPVIEYVELDEIEEVETFDPDLNETVIIEVNKVESRVIGVEDIGLRVYDAPKNNIRYGLDLQGGTRVVLEPEEKVSSEELDTVIDNMKQRLNLFGLSDLSIRKAGDLSGNQFIVVEIAGVSEEEVKDLLAQQGKFEAKIGNETVFLGGKDITYVCKTAQCSGIDPTQGCGETESGSVCRFRFSISLSQDAAERFADITEKLDVVSEGTQQYLSEDIELYLDDKLVDSLKIGAELKGSPSTDIQISGSGSGRTRTEAVYDTLEGMKELQTVLVTGSLPVKLNIIQTDNISPSLGKEFLTNALMISLLSIVAVVLIVYFRYKKIKIAVPIIIVIVSEIILILGVAAFFGQNLDIASIAGIIIAIGTGVDDQIIITDETLRKEKDEDDYLDWKQKIKRAFFMVIAAYFATSASMVPLLFAGAGLLKGFAITTLIGLTNGVLITRPAFSRMMEVLLEDNA